MPPKTPGYWNENGMMSALLLPLSWVYSAGSRLKNAFAKPYTSRLPVICIGGVVVGGSGKTPTTHALLKLMAERKIFERPVVLTRGYGGTVIGPSLVDLDHHSASDVGDEALLHATYVPTIVSRDRADGAKLAEAMGADVIILDDGLQNTTLVKDLSFLVIDSKQGIGNGQLLPAGPLREPINNALKRCACVVEINGDMTLKTDKPIVLTSIAIISEHDKSKSYFAFAGLGRPEKFKETLESNGFSMVGFKAYPDHHPYTEEDMRGLMLESSPHRLITTEKDFVKIPDSFKDSVDVVSIELTFIRPDLVVELIQQSLIPS